MNISDVVILWKELREYKTVLWNLIWQNLMLRYRRTVLGYFWTLVNPLLMMSVTAVVFSSLFKEDIKNYAIFLFSGMIPWNFFSLIITQSAGAYVNNESLIKKIYIPKILFPLSMALGMLVDSMFAFVSLLIIAGLIGSVYSVSLFFLPVSYLLLFMFAFGLALIVSVVTVYFRDLQHVIVILMQAWFFLTPVMYKNRDISGIASYFMHLNPLIPYIDLFRSPLYMGVMPSESSLYVSFLLSTVSMVSGLVIYLANEKKIIFRL